MKFKRDLLDWFIQSWNTYGKQPGVPSEQQIETFFQEYFRCRRLNRRR